MTHYTSLLPVADVDEARRVAESYAFSRPRLNSAVVALAVAGVPRPEIADMTGLSKPAVRMILLKEASRQ